MFGQRMSGTGMEKPCDLPTWETWTKGADFNDLAHETMPISYTMRPPVSY